MRRCIPCNITRLSIIVLLLLPTCKINQQVANEGLERAVLANDLNGIKNYLRKGASVNYHEPEKGWTPLLFAVEGGETEIARFLLDNGADPNEVSVENKVSPLQRAASNGFLEIADMLLKKGADLDHQDSKLGATPLMLAAVNGHADVLALLLKQQALIDVRGHRGESALFLAVSGEHTEVVKMLLAAGANKERPDIYGKTCLQKATELNNNKIINLLNQ